VNVNNARNADHCVEYNVLLQSTVITYMNGVASNLHYGVKYLLSYNSGKYYRYQS